jgi:hypothetical protein
MLDNNITAAGMGAQTHAARSFSLTYFERKFAVDIDSCINWRRAKSKEDLL